MSDIGKMKSVTVDLTKPSYYHAPKKRTFSSGLLRFRLGLAYRTYRRLLQRFADLDPHDELLIVDIGCGSGYLSSSLQQWFPGATVVGFDYDWRLLQEASERGSDVHTLQGNAEKLPLQSESASAILSLHLVEHLYHPEWMLQEVHRILQPGGVFIIATPNPDGLSARLMDKQWSGLRDDHVSLLSPTAWHRLLQEQGFSPRQEGTTLLSGIPWVRKSPLALLNWGLLALFGTFPWRCGEAYVAVWQRQ